MSYQVSIMSKCDLQSICCVLDMQFKTNLLAPKNSVHVNGSFMVQSEN